jgi:transposase-like protein
MAQRPESRTARLWLERVRLWQHSQLTARDYCQRHRLCQPSFYSWRRILRERGLIGDGAQVTPAAATPAFLKVTVNTDAPVAPAIELVLGKGRLLRVRPGFDADLLRQLVRVLEEPSC